MSPIRRTVQVGATATAMAGLVLASAAGMQPAQAAASAPQAAEADIDSSWNANHTRASLGLPLLPDPDVEPLGVVDRTAYGLPVNRQELQRLRLLDAYSAVLSELDEVLADEPGYASLSVDRRSAEPGVKLVAHGDAVSAALNLLGSALPRTQVTITTPVHDRKSLAGQLAAADAALPALARGTSGIAGYGLDLNKGIAYVNLTPGNGRGSSTADEVARLLPQAELRMDGGDSDAATRYDQGGHPVYGGSRIYQKGGGQCTATLGGYISGVPYLLTAGHCDTNRQGFTWGAVGGRDLGLPGKNGYTNPATSVVTCDCVVIRLPGTGFVSGRVYVGGAEGVEQPAPFRYDRTSTTADGTGDNYASVCFSGVKSGLRCGTVIDQFYRSIRQGGAVTVAAPRTDINNIKGDSGGPVGQGGSWVGIVSGGSNCSDDGDIYCTNMNFTRSTSLAPDYGFNRATD